MRSLKRLSVPVLLGVLLVATVAGVASARSNAGPSQQAWRVLTVPADDCIPYDAEEDWSSWGQKIYCETGGCSWRCVVHFPAAGEQAVGAVNVKRVTMYAYDNTGAGEVIVKLRKVYPPNAGSQDMAVAGTADSTADPQTVVDTSIEYNPVYRSQAPVIWVSITATSINVYGFYVHYTW
jgi:hypothetical protein